MKVAFNYSGSQVGLIQSDRGVAQTQLASRSYPNAASLPFRKEGKELRLAFCEPWERVKHGSVRAQNRIVR